MLDVVAFLEAAGAGSGFVVDETRLPEPLDLILARDGAPRIIACMIMTPDDGQSEPAQNNPDQDDDGSRQDQDDAGAQDA